MKEMVMSEETIFGICKRLGEEISKDLQNEEKLPIFVCVMKGAIQFMVDLMKHVTIPSIIDYVQLSSYEGTSSTGNVKLIKDMSYSVDGRTIVIVEDVVDTGYSMEFLLKHLQKIGKPKRILICALFNKINAHKVDIHVDYVGEELKENKFLLGCGFDYKDIQRNIPYVYVPTTEEIVEMDRILKEKL